MVRLAFAVAINVDPEILLVDEALAVGDIYFRQRCMRKVHELRARGITILFVSHAMADVKALGDRSLWLEQGRVVELGDTDRVVSKYLAAMVEKDSAYIAQQQANSRRSPASGPGARDRGPHSEYRPPLWRRARRNSGHRRAGSARNAFPTAGPWGANVVRISVRAKAEIAHPNVGFIMRNHLGVDFAGTNSAARGPRSATHGARRHPHHGLSHRIAGTVPSVIFIFAGHRRWTARSFSRLRLIDNAIAVQMVRGGREVYGFLHLPCRVMVNARLGAGAVEAVKQSSDGAEQNHYNESRWSARSQNSRATRRQSKPRGSTTGV